jgi:2,4-dienoyl-CoA reductase-like NADH-dependent reductase (Old Yellow Enzyme family)
MPHLFDPLRIRGLTLRNRVVMSPMCQYSATDGVAGDHHLVHYGSRAAGGVGLVMVEATAVEPRGRISPGDLGLWSDAQVDGLARVVRVVESYGAVAGIQLAHAGRKAGTARPWEGGLPVPAESGGWTAVAPSALAFAEGYAVPHALGGDDVAQVPRLFADAARRALDAGFRVVEVHAAHGYLLHQFLSPLTNHRDDIYGGTPENRARLVRDVVSATREAWPGERPLFLRLSATDWAPGGWDLDASVDLARVVKGLGVDLVDTSSGGLLAGVVPPAGPGFQVPLAERIRHQAGVATGAVGLITAPEQADQVIRTGQADLVFLGRELLRDPSWTLRAARVLGHEGPWPQAYLRAKL